MKNTFAKSRRTNKTLINKFEAANESLKLATEEIDRLNKSIDIKDICIKSLEIKEKELSDKIYSLYDKVKGQTEISIYNYNAWLKEHETNRKLSIGLTVMGFIILIGYIFIGMVLSK